MWLLAHLGNALLMGAYMGWQMLWALIVGFGLSAIVHALVPKEKIAALLPDESPRSIAIATALGAASSSCSYAAVAIARTLFRKGANFNAAMAFQFASTNLVFELGLALVVILGWRFAVAELIGGPIMIVILVLLLRLFLTPRLLEEARQNAERGRLGRMEGHAAMDMSVPDEPSTNGASTRVSFWQRLRSPQALTSISHTFVMEWAAVWVDIVLGLAIAGVLAVWVPTSFWQRFFLVDHPVLSRLWGPFIGPLVAVLSFVCSVGNVPLTAVLWHGGISFGGALAFLYGDLIILPILNIYRKYYGIRVAALLFVLFYIAMALAALIVEFLFAALHLQPQRHPGHMAMGNMQPNFQWDATTILNIVFLIPAIWLAIRFFRTGGLGMLRHMNEPMDDAMRGSGDHHAHQH
jgi:uncharacterized membrane protein YraQ (UPF0718 family)